MSDEPKITIALSFAEFEALRRVTEVLLADHRLRKTRVATFVSDLTASVEELMESGGNEDMKKQEVTIGD